MGADHLVSHLSQLPNGKAKIAELRRIVRGASKVKSIDRAALIASKADGNSARATHPTSACA